MLQSARSSKPHVADRILKLAFIACTVPTYAGGTSLAPALCGVSWSSYLSWHRAWNSGLVNMPVSGRLRNRRFAPAPPLLTCHMRTLQHRSMLRFLGGSGAVLTSLTKHADLFPLHCFKRSSFMAGGEHPNGRGRDWERSSKTLHGVGWRLDTIGSVSGMPRWPQYHRINGKEPMLCSRSGVEDAMLGRIVGCCAVQLLEEGQIGCGRIVLHCAALWVGARRHCQGLEQRQEGRCGCPA